MATDRTAVLTVRAHLAGAIDFRRARLLDAAWWRRTNAVLRAIESERDLAFLQAALTLQAGLLANPRLTDESFKEAQRLSKEAFGEIFNLVRPWAARSGAQARQQEVETLKAAYKRLIGDPDDPAFRVEMLRNAAALAAPPADDGVSPEERLNAAVVAAGEERARREREAVMRRRRR